MRFALMATTTDGERLVVYWARGGEGYELLGTSDVIRRAERLVKHGRTVRAGASSVDRVVADLTEAHRAYATLTAAMRERADIITPIDFAGQDDDGLPITFIPAPEAKHL